MNASRRHAIRILAGAITATVGVATAANGLRRGRRLRRRLVRRRFRRVAFTRVVFGRPFWVVPMALAVGWELSHERRIVVVKEIQVVEKEGKRTEVAVVEGGDGKRESVEVIREDNEKNREELEGSELKESDRSSPSRAVEVEEEVEE